MDKTKLANLKALAFKFLNFAKDAEPQKFDAVKVKDGETMVEFDPELTIGSPVLVASGAGSIPATDQTYTFDNGVSFVTKDGLIESVIADGKQEVETPKADESLAGETVSKADYDALLARVEALEKAEAKEPTDFSHLPTKEDLNAFTEHLKTVGGVIEELSQISMESPEEIESDPEAAKAQAFSNVADRFSK